MVAEIERGKTHVLGWAVHETFGIWSLQRGGAPVGTYPKAGWAMAHGDFSRLEKETPRKPEPGSSTIPTIALVALGGVAMVVGSFMPWITVQAPFVGNISRSGIDGGGDGLFTAGLGVVTALIALARFTATRLPSLVQRSSIVTGIAAGALAVFEIHNVQQRIATATGASNLVTGAVGAGLYVIIGGAVLALVGGLILRQPEHN